MCEAEYGPTNYYYITEYFKMIHPILEMSPMYTYLWGYNNSQIFYPFLKQNYKITINLNNKPNLHFDLSSIK
jgi:hypothetical protein